MENQATLEKEQVELKRNQLFFRLYKGDEIIQERIIETDVVKNKNINENINLSYKLKNICDKFELELAKKHNDMFLKGKIEHYEGFNFGEKNYAHFKLENNNEVVQEITLNLKRFQLDVLNNEDVSFYYFFKDISNEVEEFVNNI